MKRRIAFLLVFLALVVMAGSLLLAARPAVPLKAEPADSGQGLEETLWAIDRARVTTRILYVTAHPDDEPGAVLAYLARGLNADVALLAITRGEGGQNALGPEYGPQLGAIRTEELLAATRQYGVRLYFTRAPDFGYSKTAEETLRVWGDQVLDDMVRVIREFRPHIVINHWGGVRSGHGHHQAAGILTARAVEAAGDPKKFPEQLGAGAHSACENSASVGPQVLKPLRVEISGAANGGVETPPYKEPCVSEGSSKPWRADSLLQLARGEAAGGFPIPVNEISPLLGKSWSELGIEGFLNHRTQGIAGVRGSPFLRRPVRLVAVEGRQPDAALLSARLTSIADRYPEFASMLRPALEQAEEALARAKEAAQQLDWAAAAHALVRAAESVRVPWTKLNVLNDWNRVRDAYSDLRDLGDRIDEALRLVCGIRIETQADRSELVAGESFTVRVDVRYRSEIPIHVEAPHVDLPEGWTAEPLETLGPGSYRFRIAIPAGARRPVPDEPWVEWMEPLPPPLVVAGLSVQLDDHIFIPRVPANAVRATSTGADVMPLELVPAATLAVEPRQFVLREKQATKPLEVFARVHHYGTKPTKVSVGLDAPAGWRASAVAPIEFPGVGDELVRFTVTPPTRLGGLVAGSAKLSAYARREGDAADYRTSLEPLPSLPTRLWSEPAVAQVRVFDVDVPAGLRVGYVAAENDSIPDALRQLGIHVEMLNEVALAFGELSRYDAICIGIRAYELRSDLPRVNRRLLDYAAAGGTLVVQYQRESTWNALKPAPYPATVGQPTIRTSVEDSPVRFVAPEHFVLRFPNRISEKDFEGWVQERGLYYWGEFDKRYQPLLGLRDPGEEEALGGLVYARTGKGVYIYTGLSFFRQLPAGVPGAYRLFVNLLSQSEAPK
jgi:LmbE family N-acetylglucosaminyl deacetylase